MPDLRFDQGDTGTVNRSRSDIDVDVEVDIVALNVVGTAIFGLLDRPLGSSAAIGGTGSTRQITGDVPGPHRVRITDDDGEVIHTFTVRTALLDLDLPASNEIADPDANDVDSDPGSWVDDSESNEGGSFKGWHPKNTEALLKLESAAASGSLLALDGLQQSQGADTDHDTDIAPGQCRADDNKFTIVNGATVTAALDAATGAGGLDTGTAATLTFYYVWLIADSTATNPVALMYSLSVTAPTMPSGYDKKRRVGTVKTGDPANIDAYRQEVLGRRREFFWTHQDWIDNDVLENGSASSYTATSSIEGVWAPPPPAAAKWLLQAVGVKVGGSSSQAQFFFKPQGYGTNSEDFWQITVGLNSSEDIRITSYMEFPLGDDGTIVYRVNPGGDCLAAIYISGWVEYL